MKNAPIEASLLLVDDDPAVIQVLNKILSDYSSVRFATSGADALRLARESLPDLILLDAQLGDMSGLEVCESLKADPALANVPVVFVSSHQEAELEVAVLKLGAVDFIRKPFNGPQVIARVDTQLKLKRLADDLRLLSRVDALTRLGNDRAYEETLRRESLRAVEAQGPVAAVRFEIDFFEAFESTYGAKATAEALRAVAKALRHQLLRPGDVAFRLGRAAFGLVLPDTTGADALAVANRLLRVVEALDIPHHASTVSRHLTLSAGIASFEGTQATEIAHDGIAPALDQTALAALAQAQHDGWAQANLGTAAGGLPPVGAATPA
ncbi:MAG: response regulator [Gammaproteobacteria bacterium]|nr:response regulator [Gammaproteobacteria bacterium]